MRNGLLRKLFLGLTFCGALGCATAPIIPDEPGRVSYSSFRGKFGQYSISTYLNGTMAIEKRSNGATKRFTFPNKEAYDAINQTVFNATGMRLNQLQPNPEWFFGNCDLADVSPRDGIITTEEADYAINNWIFERKSK